MCLFDNNLYLLKIVDFEQASNFYQEKMTTVAFEEKLLLQHRDERVNNIIMPRLRKKYSYEWEGIHENEKDVYIWLDTRLDLKREKIFSLWKNDFDLKKYLHFTEHKHIHYNMNEEKTKICVLFLLGIEYICGIIDRGENEDRKHYFKSTAFLQTGYIYEIFAQIEDKMITDLGVEYNTIIDSAKFEINPSKNCQ